MATKNTPQRKEKNICIYVTKDVHLELKKLAKQEGISLAKMCEKVILRGLENS